MPTVEIKQPGRNLKEKALLATALLEADVPVRKAAKAAGISPRTAARLSVSKREGTLPTFLDPEQVSKIRSSIQDKCLVLSDAVLGTLTYSKADKASLGETVNAAAKLAELAGIKQPDRTEHFHAVMLKFAPEEKTPLIIQEKSETP